MISSTNSERNEEEAYRNYIIPAVRVTLNRAGVSPRTALVKLTANHDYEVRLQQTEAAARQWSVTEAPAELELVGQSYEELNYAVSRIVQRVQTHQQQSEKSGDPAEQKLPSLNFKKISRNTWYADVHKDPSGETGIFIEAKTLTLGGYVPEYCAYHLNRRGEEITIGLARTTFATMVTLAREYAGDLARKKKRTNRPPTPDLQR